MDKSTGATEMLGLDNPIHLVFLLVLLLLVFGARRLPEMGRSLGTGMRGFKDALSGESSHAAELPEPARSVTGGHEEPIASGAREERP
jgi:sec-independent protein translocase protein TatA